MPGAGRIGYLYQGDFSFGSSTSGFELFNNMRTLAYLTECRQTCEGLCHLEISSSDACVCPILCFDIDGNPQCWCEDDGELRNDICPEGSIDPTCEIPVPPAPWYCEDRPESSEFLGVLITSVEGWDWNLNRNVTPRGSSRGGAVFGPELGGPRTWTFQGLMLSKSCCGASYGRQWLTQALSSQGCNECGTFDMFLRACCPDEHEVNPCDAEDPCEIEIVPAGLDEGLWMSLDNAVTGVDFDADFFRGKEDCCEIIPIEIQITAGNPNLFSRGELVAEDDLVPCKFQCIFAICDFIEEADTDGSCLDVAAEICPDCEERCTSIEEATLCIPSMQCPVCMHLGDSTYNCDPCVSTGVIELENDEDVPSFPVSISHWDAPESMCGILDSQNPDHLERLIGWYGVKSIPANSTLFIDGVRGKTYLVDHETGDKCPGTSYIMVADNMNFLYPDTSSCPDSGGVCVCVSELLALDCDDPECARLHVRLYDYCRTLAA